MHAVRNPKGRPLQRLSFVKKKSLSNIWHSCSQWSQSGGWQFCSDYRHLNATTTPGDCHLFDFAAHLAGACLFLKVYLMYGYQQVAVAETDIPKIAVVASSGLFEFECPLSSKMQNNLFSGWWNMCFYVCLFKWHPCRQYIAGGAPGTSLPAFWAFAAVWSYQLC